MGFVFQCKQHLTPADWHHFQQINAIENVVQFLSSKLSLDSSDPSLNPMLGRFQSHSKLPSIDTVVQKVSVLNSTNRTKDLQSTANQLTKLITAESQRKEAGRRRRLALLFCCRAEVHVRMHKKVLEQEGRHQLTSYTAALIDLESAHHCDPVTPLLKNLRCRLTAAKNAASGQDWSLQTRTEFPVKLMRVVPKETEDQKSPDSCGGMSDEGYRSRSRSPAVGYQICHSPAKGRLLRATRAFRRGEIVLTEDAFAFALSSEFMWSRCSGCCSRIRDTVYKCPRNCALAFCRVACYEQISAVHEFECSMLGIIIDENTHFLLNIRCFLLRNGPRARSASQLIHHFARYSPNDRFEIAVRGLYACTVLHQMGALDIDKDMRKGCPLMSSVLRQRCQIDMNSVSLENRIGAGIFVDFSLICHSCDPNIGYSCQSRANDHIRVNCTAVQIRLKAERDVSQWSELTIAYTTESDLQKRRCKLWHQYLFECFCSRCLQQIRATLPLSHFTPASNAFTCTSCGHRLLHRPQTTSIPDVEVGNDVYACYNAACSDLNKEVDLRKKITFARDYLSLAVRTCANYSSPESLRTKMGSYLTVYHGFIRQFMTNNIVRLDFETLLCRLSFLIQDLDQSLMWAEEGFRTSRSLLGCQRETALAYFRIVLIRKHQSRLHDQHQQTVLPDISDEEMTFFHDEVRAGIRTKGLMAVIPSNE